MALDEHWLALSVECAYKARIDHVRPNPRVGCVIVKADQCLAQGWHERLGGPHAEVHALSQLSASDTQGATAYVSLEPCVHQGRTGPCTQALIDAGITRVVFGELDPNPLVSGKGVSALKAAGVRVDGPMFLTNSEPINPGFMRRMQGGLPYVRAKVAMSLDGKTAMASGESQWITSQEARLDGHHQRLQHGAVITGINTVLQDDCQLTVRLDLNDLIHPPLRVVLDRQGRLPENAAMLNDDAPILWCVAQEYMTHGHIKSMMATHSQLSLLPVAQDGYGLTLVDVLAHLGAHYQCNEVMIEAGATLTGAFIKANLLDELLIYQAPKLMGHKGRSAFTLDFDYMHQTLSVVLKEQRAVGPDQFMRCLLKPMGV